MLPCATQQPPSDDALIAVPSPGARPVMDFNKWRRFPSNRPHFADRTWSASP
ncbi:hypothetical protein HanRHA438_Chr05g0213491 [Helianthus annuus]|nr:hypothetical protein HanRHA438_Chr05g0213491 [Helianthus annuus]